MRDVKEPTVSDEQVFPGQPQHSELLANNTPRNVVADQSESSISESCVVNVYQPHHIYGHLSKGLSLFLAEIAEDITVLLLEKLEAHSQVMVLQHGGVVVHESELRVWKSEEKNNLLRSRWVFSSHALKFQQQGVFYNSGGPKLLTESVAFN